MNSGSQLLTVWIKSIGTIIDPKQFATEEQELIISELIQTSKAMNFSSIPENKLFNSLLSLRIFRLKLQLVAEKEVQRSRKFLLQRNGLLIAEIVQKYGFAQSNWDDLAQAGAIGFNRALEKFDASKGCRLSTYSYWWIRQGVQKEIESKCRAIKLPNHLYTKKNKIKKAILKFQKENQTRKWPSSEVLSEMTGINRQLVELTQSSFGRIYSYDEAFKGSTDRCLLDLLESSVKPGLDIESLKELEEGLKVELEKLTSDDFQLINSLFGFQGEPISNIDLSRRLNIGRLEVLNKKRRILRILKKSIGTGNLYKYAKSFFEE